MRPPPPSCSTHGVSKHTVTRRTHPHARSHNTFDPVHAAYRLRAVHATVAALLRQLQARAVPAKQGCTASHDGSTCCLRPPGPSARAPL